MSRIPGRLGTFVRLAARVCTAVGFIVILVTITPVLKWWTQAFAGPWGSQDGDVLIVLGGDLTAPDLLGITSYWRAVYTIFTWREGHFRQLIVTGRGTAPLMRDFVVCNGIPREAVTIDDRATSTRENALNVAAILRGGSGRFVLLTSDYHMHRAAAAFRKAGITAERIPFPDAMKRLNNFEDRPLILWVLIEETAKNVYYKWRGWV